MTQACSQSGYPSSSTSVELSTFFFKVLKQGGSLQMRNLQ